MAPSPARSLSSLTTTVPSRSSSDSRHKDEQKPPMVNSLKVRAAIFEQQNHKSVPITVELPRSNRSSLRGEKSRFARNSLERDKTGKLEHNSIIGKNMVHPINHWLAKSKILNRIIHQYKPCLPAFPKLTPDCPCCSN